MLVICVAEQLLVLCNAVFLWFTIASVFHILLYLFICWQTAKMAMWLWHTIKTYSHHC